MFFLLFIGGLWGSSNSGSLPPHEEGWRYHGCFNLTVNPQDFGCSQSPPDDIVPISPEALRAVHTGMGAIVKGALETAQAFSSNCGVEAPQCAAMVRISPIIMEMGASSSSPSYRHDSLIGFYHNGNTVNIARSNDQALGQEFVVLSSFLGSREYDKVRKGDPTSIPLSEHAGNTNQLTGLNVGASQQPPCSIPVGIRSCFDPEELLSTIQQRWFEPESTLCLPEHTMQAIREKHAPTQAYLRRYLDLKMQFQNLPPSSELFRALINLWNDLCVFDMPIPEEKQALFNALAPKGSKPLRKQLLEELNWAYFGQNSVNATQALFAHMPFNINDSVNQYCCAEQGLIPLLLLKQRELGSVLPEGCKFLLMHIHATWIPCHHCITSLVRTFEGCGLAGLPIYIVFSADEHYKRRSTMFPYVGTTSHHEFFTDKGGILYHSHEDFKVKAFKMTPFWRDFIAPTYVPVILLEEQEQEKCKIEDAWELPKKDARKPKPKTKGQQ